MSDVIEQQYKRILDNRIAEIQGRLRRLADSLDTYREDLKDAASYSDVASYVVTDVNWMVANLNLGSLVANAGRADLEREKASSAEIQ